MVLRVLSLGGHDDVQNTHGRRVRSHLGDMASGGRSVIGIRRIYQAHRPTGTVAHRLTAGVVVEWATSSDARRCEFTVSEVLRLLSDCSGRLLSLDEWCAMAERAEFPVNKVDASVRDLGQADVLAVRRVPAAAAP